MRLSHTQNSFTLSGVDYDEENLGFEKLEYEGDKFEQNCFHLHEEAAPKYRLAKDLSAEEIKALLFN